MLRVLILCLVCLALLPEVTLGYSQMEILKILFSGIKSRDASVQRAVVLLRQKGLLEARFGSLSRIAGITETPEVQRALLLLKSRGFLPDAQTSPRALSDYLGQVQALQDDEQEGDAAVEKRTLMSQGVTTRPTPFYIYIASQKAYILGGILPEAAELEMTCARADGFVEVVFPSIHRGFVSYRHVEVVEDRGAAYRQDRGAIREVACGPLRCYRARHRGASLWVVQTDLKPDGLLTIRPFVVGKYNRVAPGDNKVSLVQDMAIQSGALAAINGTFFINSPGSTAYGTPLAPIIINGRPAWSYHEKRVLDMNRAYLAITETNRAVMGETTLPASEILSACREGTFNPEGFREESIVHLMGGLGWLIRDGDRWAWRRYAGKQFGYSYYSHYVKRPQSVLAVSGNGRRVAFIIQEGLPHSSRPLSLPELSSYVAANFGAPWAVFLDGGGSTELVLGGRTVTRQENNGPYRKNSTALIVTRTALRPPPSTPEGSTDTDPTL